MKKIIEKMIIPFFQRGFSKGFIVLLLLFGCGNDNPVVSEDPPKPNHEEGDLVIDLPGGVKMAFVWIEPGTFMMGAREGEPHPERELPRHQVTITKGFYLGKYEVTQQQWLSLVDKEPWILPDSFPRQIGGIGDDFPVVNVYRGDIDLFLEHLNAHFQTQAFRVPTDAEWEYACRAGTETIWSFGDDAELLDEYAWYGQNLEDQSQVVGLKLPNPWGLYDMHGNVREAMLDGFRIYTLEPQIDPVGPKPERLSPLPDLLYMERGGSWRGPDFVTTSSVRVGVGVASIDIGFRVLRAGP